jgi:hypothetical protein
VSGANVSVAPALVCFFGDQVRAVALGQCHQLDWPIDLCAEARTVEAGTRRYWFVVFALVANSDTASWPMCLVSGASALVSPAQAPTDPHSQARLSAREAILSASVCRTSHERGSS